MQRENIPIKVGLPNSDDMPLLYSDVCSIIDGTRYRVATYANAGACIVSALQRLLRKKRLCTQRVPNSPIYLKRVYGVKKIDTDYFEK